MLQPEAELSSARHSRAGGQRMTRSCDACRRRKVQCDAQKPSCANCKVIGLVCQTLTHTLKRGRKAAAFDHRLSVGQGQGLDASHDQHAQHHDHSPREALTEPQLNRSRPGSSVSLSPSSAPGDNYHTQFTELRWNTESPTRSSHFLDHAPNSMHRSAHVTVELAGDDSSHAGQCLTPSLHRRPSLASPSLTPSNRSCNDKIQPWLAEIAAGLFAEGVTQSATSQMAACIDLFFDNVYPTYPVLYRPTIDAAVLNCEDENQAWDSKLFALITACCAYTLAVLPNPVSGSTSRIADIFFRASQKALDSYVEEDLENPDHTSIVIRMFHSGCIHASGKNRPSWYVLGDCIRIVLLLRLHDEKSYNNMPYIEGQLCRRAFWTLYTGDKSAAVLGDYPICIRNDLFAEGITVSYPDHIAPQDSLEITTWSGITNHMSLLDGFNANQTLWLAAEPLLTAPSAAEKPPGASNTQGPANLIHDFLNFCTCLDEISSALCFQSSNGIIDERFHFRGPDSPARRTASDRNPTNEHTEFFYNKILDSYGDMMTPGAEGVHDDDYTSITLSYMIAALEIGEQLLHFIHTSTLELIRLNGEACVEKIRLVGAAILELTDRNPPIPLLRKASRYMELYPHILAMLESKASDRAEYSAMSS